MDLTNDTINDTIKRPSPSISDDERSVLSFYQAQPGATKKELAETLGKSTATVNRIVKRLTEKGLLKRVGPNKGGHWKVLADDRNR